MVQTKICCRCHKTKPITEFPKDKRRKDGLKSFCKQCHNDYEKEWRKENPEKLRTRKAKYYSENKESINKKARIYRKNHPKDYKKYARHYRQKLKLQTLVHYSGNPPRCACCGETHIELLTIDHIHGGGNKHRKKIGQYIYSWLKKNNYPKGFRVLCWNCNCSIGFYGYCPHNNKEVRTGEDIGKNLKDCKYPTLKVLSHRDKEILTELEHDLK